MAGNRFQCRTVRGIQLLAIDEDLFTDERLHDGGTDDLSASDLEPPGQVQDASRLQALIASAQRLSGQSGDPKLAALIQHVGQLLRDGYHPVVFCRYIATAHYVATHLKAQFANVTIEAITGELTPEERRELLELIRDYIGGPGPFGHSHDFSCECGEEEEHEH